MQLRKKKTQEEESVPGEEAEIAGGSGGGRGGGRVLADGRRLLTTIFQTVRWRPLGSFAWFSFLSFFPVSNFHSSLVFFSFRWLSLLWWVFLSLPLPLRFFSVFFGFLLCSFFFRPRRCAGLGVIYRTSGRGFNVEPRSGSRSGCPGGPPSASVTRRVVGHCLLSVAHRRGASVGGKRDLQKNKKYKLFLLPLCNVRGKKKVNSAVQNGNVRSFFFMHEKASFWIKRAVSF